MWSILDSRHIEPGKNIKKYSKTCLKRPLKNRQNKDLNDFVCLFDLILYVHSTIFQLCGTKLPGLNQY